MDLFPTEENGSPPVSHSGYSREVIDEVWSEAEPIPGNDEALWRKDANGIWINRLDYGRRNSQFGWEIEPVGADLQPVHWECSSGAAGSAGEPDEEEENGLLF